MQLDRVRGDSCLSVLEIEEGDADDARLRAEPQLLPYLAHLPATIRRRPARTRGRFPRSIGASSKVIRVREEAPTVGSGEKLVARPGVADHAPIRVERIPVHGRKDGVLAEVANVERDPRPRLDARRTAIRVDRRSEVIPHGAAVRHVDRLPLADRKERAEAEARNTLHIACDVATGVLVEQRIDRGGHEGTVAVVAAFGQTRAALS